MKKIINKITKLLAIPMAAILLTVGCASAAVAAPHGGPGGGLRGHDRPPAPHREYRPHHGHHHHGDSAAVALIGGAILGAVLADSYR